MTMDKVFITIVLITAQILIIIIAHHRGWMKGFDECSKIWRKKEE